MVSSYQASTDPATKGHGLSTPIFGMLVFKSDIKNVQWVYLVIDMHVIKTSHAFAVYEVQLLDKTSIAKLNVDESDPFMEHYFDWFRGEYHHSQTRRQKIFLWCF